MGVVLWGVGCGFDSLRCCFVNVAPWVCPCGVWVMGVILWGVGGVGVALQGVGCGCGSSL